MELNLLEGLASLFTILLISPFFFGLVNKFKAILTGKAGAPVLQPYYELAKNIKKETINSAGSSYVSRIAPVINFTSLILAAVLLPVGNWQPLIHFEGDIILFAYSLGLARFFLILAAMDIGSSFEGMGASREATFALFAEPIFFFTVGSIAFVSGFTSLYSLYHSIHLTNLSFIVFIVICSISVFILAITECSRMPVDDPNTHLELTMIHEVMILDNSGVDLFLYQYSSQIKLFMYAVLEISLFNPFINNNGFIGVLIFMIGLLVLTLLLGLTETITSRIKMNQVSQYLLFATAIGILNLLIYTFA